MTQWIELLVLDAGFLDSRKPVHCMLCSSQGETDYVMELDEEKGMFECPRCHRKLPCLGRLSTKAMRIYVGEFIRRGHVLTPGETELHLM